MVFDQLHLLRNDVELVPNVGLSSHFNTIMCIYLKLKMTLVLSCFSIRISIRSKIIEAVQPSGNTFPFSVFFQHILTTCQIQQLDQWP